MRCVLPLLVVVAIVLGGCTQAYSAEREGRDLGESLCDLRDATTVEEAAAEADDIAADVEALAEQYAMFTAEDRADIESRLADLRTHAEAGDAPQAQEDLASIRRSVSDIAGGLDETSQAAWDGVEQGLDGCITS